MLEELKKLSKDLSNTFSAKNIIELLSVFFAENFGTGSIDIYVFDETTNNLRDFEKNWLYIEEICTKQTIQDLYRHYELLKNTTYTEDKNILYYGLYKGDRPIGLIKFDVSYIETDNLIEFLNTASYFISLKVQNIILSEKMQKNVDFHDSMKNIAKIIETQYELNYIVPIIGEMIDKFISNHLIYIFLRNEETSDYTLVWPNSCRDEKIQGLLNVLTPNSDCIMTADKKIGLFPLVTEGKLIGCIVAKSTDGKLNEKEVEYIEQLTNQAATTIDRANVYAEILKHATLDALTGFYNRRQLEERIKQEVSGAKRKNKPLCAIMTDIDFFKQVNDTYGHAIGDIVLKTVSMVIKSQLRDYDIAGRYGGEEFTILLPYTNINDAKMVAERLRASIAKKTIDISKVVPDSPHKNINVTISLGVHQLSKDDNEVDLLQKADEALYRAKGNGRNKVVVYGL